MWILRLNRRNACGGQKLCDIGHCYDGSPVYLQWSHGNDPLSEPFRNVFLKTILPLSKNIINLIFDLPIWAFFGRGVFVVFHSSLRHLFSGLITCNHTTKEIWLIGDSVNKINTLVFRMSFCSILWFFGNILTYTILYMCFPFSCGFSSK